MARKANHRAPDHTNECGRIFNEHLYIYQALIVGRHFSNSDTTPRLGAKFLRNRHNKEKIFTFILLLMK
jgi:hypothetical protein